MYPNQFSDSLAFPRVYYEVHICVLFKFLNKYWMDCFLDIHVPYRMNCKNACQPLRLQVAPPSNQKC